MRGPGDTCKHRLRPRELANQTRNFPSFTRHRRQGPSSLPLPSRAPRREPTRAIHARPSHHMRQLSRPPPPRPPHPSPVTSDGLRDPRDGPRDPRNSRAAVTPHATTITAATSDPHPPPRSPIAPCDCVCEVIARSTRDSLGTCEVCARQRLAQEEHSDQRQAVSRVTHSSVRLLLGAVVCWAAWKGTTRPTAAPRGGPNRGRRLSVSLVVLLLNCFSSHLLQLSTRFARLKQTPRQEKNEPPVQNEAIISEEYTSLCIWRLDQVQLKARKRC